MNNEYIIEAEQMLDFIAQSPSPFHVVDNVAKMLKDAGFEELCLKQRWQIKSGGRYFTRRNGTAIIAFTIANKLADNGFRIVTAHSDSPTFRIKPEPEILADGQMVKIETETYGGTLLYTWLDRPLSIAGRVSVKSDNPMHPKKLLVDVHRPIGVIPSVAIHFNRSVNDSLSLNKQTDMPVFTQMIDLLNPSLYRVKDIVAEQLDINADDILDFDLNLYDTERGTIFGADNSLILSPKLDDLSMVYAAIKSLCSSADCNTNKMVCIFDNEEVGSGTKQGAASPLLKNIIERIAEQMKLTVEDCQRMTYNSFMISADMAHAIHPNNTAIHDPNLHPVLNGGPVIKVNAQQKYMTDGDSSAIFMSLCKDAGSPYQKFVNRSDIVGGSTLGNILTSQIDIHGVDVGNPMLAMHSARETSGVKDVTYIMNVFKKFFE